MEDIRIPQIGLGCANFMGTSLPELIELAARHGFPSLTARPLAFKQALEMGFTEKTLRSRLDESGLSATLVDGLTRGLPGVPPLEALDAAFLATLPLDVLNPPDEETCFRCAEALRVPVVNLVHYRGAALPLQEMADAVGAICQRAQARGLRMALEFLPETGLSSLSFTDAVITACGASNCGITLDVYHLDRSGGTVADIRRLPPGRITNIQISDRTPSTQITPHKPFTGRQMPGEGRLPLRELITAALVNSPNATIDIEVLNPALSGLPPDEAAARLAAAASAWRATFSSSHALD